MGQKYFELFLRIYLTRRAIISDTKMARCTWSSYYAIYSVVVATVHSLGCKVTADEAWNTTLHLFFPNGCKVALVGSP